MIKVTSRALDVLDSIWKEAGDEDKALRIVVNTRAEFGVILDQPKAGDQVIREIGAERLVISRRIADALGPVVVDCDETPNGPKLAIKLKAS
jgi:hypothetical protein